MAGQRSLTNVKIDTNVLPYKDQYAFFRENLFDAAGIEVVREGPSDAPFSFVLEHNRTPSLILLRYQNTTPCSINRSERGIANTEHNAFGVQLRYKRNDKPSPMSESRALTRSGDLRAVDIERPFFYQHQGAVVYSLNLNRRVLQNEIAISSNLHDIGLRDNPVTRVLKSAIPRVFSELRQADDKEIMTLSETLRRLAVDAIKHQWIGELETSEIRNETVLHAVVDFVRRNLHRHDLSPEMIAKGVGVSRSRLYQVCQPVDTPQRLIRSIRLEKAAAHLRSDPLSNVGDIAHRVGISTRPALSRMFTDHYGVSPSEYREGLRMRPTERCSMNGSMETVWAKLQASVKVASLN